jgi:hypothetical protein
MRKRGMAVPPLFHINYLLSNVSSYVNATCTWKAKYVATHRSKLTKKNRYQLGHFVGILELCAIDLDAGERIAEQCLRHSFDDTRFAGTCWSQKQKIRYWAAWRIKTRDKCLKDLNYFRPLLGVDQLRSDAEHLRTH